MGVDVSQHIAIRVSDIDRAARFYVGLFGGTYLTRPFSLSGPELEPLFGGHEGLEVKVCLLAFDHGNMELFEFVHPREPMGELDQTRANLVHWCIQVDDVHETLARVWSSSPIGSRGWTNSKSSMLPWSNASRQTFTSRPS